MNLQTAGDNTEINTAIWETISNTGCKQYPFGTEHTPTEVQEIWKYASPTIARATCNSLAEM
jgi:hypothetical protein